MSVYTYIYTRKHMRVYNTCVCNWWLSTKGDFVPYRTLGPVEASMVMTWRMCYRHRVGGGMLARDAATHPIMHRTVPHDKELSGPKCDGSEVKKPYTHIHPTCTHVCTHSTAERGWVLREDA